MITQRTTRLVYLYQPQLGILLLSRDLQAFYALPAQQRLCPPMTWFSCHSLGSQQQLKQAFAALCFANDDNRLQLRLKLSSQTVSGRQHPVEHHLCMVLIDQQRFICGQVCPIWNPRAHHRASHRQFACLFARPFAETSQLGSLSCHGR